MNLTNLSNRFCSLGLSRFDGRTFNQSRLFLIMLVVILVLFPLKGFSQCNVSGDIPFLADNNLPSEGCIMCTGPFFRTSDLGIVDAGVQNCEFYAADKGFFSPFGSWECELMIPNPDDQNACDAFADSVEFCVKDTSNVIFTFTPNGTDLPTLTVNKPMPNTFGFCPKSVSSFLGDNFKQEKSKPDSDVFLFDGAGGDQVTLRLETNPQEGNNGGEASLDISGSSLNEATTGAPPLELEVTLPGNGEYSITVEQPKNSAQRFRGSYILNVESAMGVGLIEPTNNVEK
jgi:hypothetical protein